MTSEIYAETFPALDGVASLQHAFLTRIPGIEVTTDRETALERLREAHAEAREALGFGSMRFITAGQVHGARVAQVDGAVRSHYPEVDGLITDEPGVCLGIYVADCCAVYLADPERGCIGLVHSGKKGTEANIVGAAIARMREAFGADPARMIVQLSPCIRPPHYEVDFAAEIVRCAHEAGVNRVVDPGTCTASDLDRYYSYRAEQGQTGRMLALLALR